LVAVYAAVVATGALSWQVYQSLSERKSRLDERKGSLGIDLSTEWRADDNKLLCATFVNRNDYSVRLDLVKIGTGPTGGIKLGQSIYPMEYIIMLAEEAGITREIPAHDSLRFVWHAAELGNLLRDIPFQPGYVLMVAIINSLGHEYSASIEIEDSRRFYPPYEIPESIPPEITELPQPKPGRAPGAQDPGISQPGISATQ